MSSPKSEEAVVDLIRETLAGIVAPGARGLIDDGAWLPALAPGATRVISCDAFQEGNDFLVQIAPVESAGYRAVAQNLSDIAAMGAKPAAFVWSLEIPKTWLKNEGELLRRFTAGAAKACTESGLLFYGGDLSFAKERFGCTITILGDAKKKPLSRKGAKVGDGIFVSRQLGLSSFGLEILLKDLASKKQSMSGKKFDAYLKKLAKSKKEAVLAHLWPKAEIARGQELAGLSSSCMDISDGLARDLTRLCKASGVGAELHDWEAAIHPALPSAKARDYALQGGEEFALLFTGAPGKELEKKGIRIGTVTSEVGEIYERRGKRRTKIAAIGYDHFTSRP